MKLSTIAFRSCKILAVQLLALASAAYGITIQYSGTGGYATGSSAFTGVVKILYNRGGQTYLCSGSLISADIVLTAGHCVDGASGWNVWFETATEITSITAAQAYLHPEYEARPYPASAIPQYDVAILRLSRAAPAGAEVYGLQLDYNGPDDTIVMLAGYGRAGGAGEALQAAGVRHAALSSIQEMSDVYNFGGADVTTPDLPLLTSLSYSPGVKAPWGQIAPGDSGGPLLYGGRILGVASAVGGLYPTDTTVAYNRIYDGLFANLSEDVTGNWVRSFVVPEPGSLLLMSGGAVFLAVWRRRKARAEN